MRESMQSTKPSTQHVVGVKQILVHINVAVINHHDVIWGAEGGLVGLG